MTQSGVFLAQNNPISIATANITMPHSLPDHCQPLAAAEKFCFACHPGVACFTECCRQLDLALTPYDVLRLRKRVGLTSSEFLAKYTLIPFTQDQKVPVPLLKMRATAEDAAKIDAFLKQFPITLTIPAEVEADD